MRLGTISFLVLRAILTPVYYLFWNISLCYLRLNLRNRYWLFDCDFLIFLAITSCKLLITQLSMLQILSIFGLRMIETWIYQWILRCFFLLLETHHKVRGFHGLRKPKYLLLELRLDQRPEASPLGPKKVIRLKFGNWLLSFLSYSFLCIIEHSILNVLFVFLDVSLLLLRGHVQYLNSVCDQILLDFEVQRCVGCKTWRVVNFYQPGLQFFIDENVET